MTEYVVVYEQGEDGAWAGWFPDLPGVYALGRTREEVAERAKEAVSAALDYARETGEPVPIPAHETGVVRIRGPQIPA